MARASAWTLLCAACLVLPAWPASAQLSGQVSLTTDYRLRGVSLSQDQPAVSLDLTYDHASGAYASGILIQGLGRDPGAALEGYAALIGYSARASGSLAWDVGVTNTGYRQQYFAAGQNFTYYYNYNEIYAGLSSEHLNAHIYYSPDYFEQKAKTVYAELNGSARPGPQWRLYGHAGLLTLTQGDWGVTANGPGKDGNVIRDPRYDFKAGLVYGLGPAKLDLAWSLVGPSRVTSLITSARSQGLAFTASCSF